MRRSARRRLVAAILGAVLLAGCETTVTLGARGPASLKENLLSSAKSFYVRRFILPVETLKLWDGLVRSAWTDGEHAYVGFGASLVALRVSGDVWPSPIAKVEMPSLPVALERKGDILYAAVGDFGVEMVEASQPDRPRRIGKMRGEGFALGLSVQGDRLAVAVKKGGVWILDVSRADRPRPIVTIPAGHANAVAWDGSDLWVADGREGVSLYDLSDASKPRCKAEVDTTYEWRPEPLDPGPLSLTVDGQAVWVANGRRGVLRVVENSNGELVVAQVISTGGFVYDAKRVGTRLWIADAVKGLMVMNLDERKPRLSAVDGTTQAFQIQAFGERAWVAAGGGGYVSWGPDGKGGWSRAGRFAEPPSARAVRFLGDWLFVAAGSAGLREYLISDDRPRLAREIDTPGYATGLDVDSNSIWIADGPFGFHRLGFSSGGRNKPILHPRPEGSTTRLVEERGGVRGSSSVVREPMITSFSDPEEQPWDVRVVGDRVYAAASDHGVSVFEDKPAGLRFIDSKSIGQFAVRLALDADSLFAADLVSGVSRMGLPDLLASPVSGIFGKRAVSVAVSDSLVFVGTVGKGVSIYGKGDPGKRLALISAAKTPFALGASGDHVVVGDSGRGVLLFDTRDPRHPDLVQEHVTRSPIFDLHLRWPWIAIAKGTDGVSLWNLLTGVDLSLPW